MRCNRNDNDETSVPTFGMRAAVVLAFLAVVALAALLAVGSPASAQVTRQEQRSGPRR